eukprot:537335-Pyramimonas_sp.AAC.1
MDVDDGGEANRNADEALVNVIKLYKPEDVNLQTPGWLRCHGSMSDFLDSIKSVDSEDALKKMQTKWKRMQFSVLNLKANLKSAIGDLKKHAALTATAKQREEKQRAKEKEKELVRKHREDIKAKADDIQSKSRRDADVVPAFFTMTGPGIATVHKYEGRHGIPLIDDAALDTPFIIICDSLVSPFLAHKTISQMMTWWADRYKQARHNRCEP